MVKKKISRLIVILASLFLCAIMLFGMGTNIMTAFAAEASTDKAVMYLGTDIKHDASKSKSLDNKRLFIAPEQVASIPGGAMQAKIENSWYTFKYGVYAHGPSYVAFDISAHSQTHKYFSAYAGLLSSASKSDGALFYVQTSENGTKWDTQAPSDTTVETDNQGRQLVKYNQNFLYFTLNVEGVKWIRLVADSNKSNSQDYVVWADAKLSTSLDDGEAVQPVTAYDTKIKAKGINASLDDPELELLVLQREFVNRVGQYALKRFTGESKDNEAMLDWLLNDLDSLREFMLGGAPHKGNYYNSLTVLSNLYKYNKQDLTSDKKLNNKFMPERTFGELCRTMMFSVALTHDGAIGSYLQGSTATNKSIPLRRYAIFKYMYQTERFVATRNADGSWKEETMTLFGSLRVEEMRFIMSNIIDDESIIWLNDYVQTRINASGKVGSLYTPHSYVRYTDPNYNNPVFYANENYDYFNSLFSVDSREVKVGDEILISDDNAGKELDTELIANSQDKRQNIAHYGLWDAKYIVPAGAGLDPYVMTVSRSGEGVTPRIQKVWMNFNNKFKTGSVCGGISKSGTNIRTSRGIPAHVIGQPGHAAILYYGQDANGNGSWKIDNDVGGWVAATKNERHLLGWGNETWHRNAGGGGTVVFFHLAQECLNDYDNYVKAEEYTWLAKVYQGEPDKQDKLYEKALTAQPKNLDAWYGLIQAYKANTAKTAVQYSALAERIGNLLWNHPMAMNCLLKLFTITTGNEQVDAALNSPIFTTQLKTIELNALTKAKSSGSSAAKSKVNLLLGVADTSVADFSFDGENSGCIVWADTYSDGSFVWKYSVDGKKTWKEVTFNEGDSHVYQLPEEDLALISADNGIYVYIVGASPDNAYKIDVAAKPAMPDTLYANDWENRVIGVDGTYEWRYCKKIETETETGTEITYTPTTGWISYTAASPDCSGDKIIEVRLKGTAKKPPSDGRIFTFTPDTDTAERKYISVNYLSIAGFSTESQDSKRPNYAVNAIDGNGKTYWHTDYAISIKATLTETTPYQPAYLTIKLADPRWISALEFVQVQYKDFSIFAKNVTVLVSEDGETWKEAGKREGFENLDDLKVVHFTESVYGQYVKLVMNDLYETNANDGVFTTVSMVNLYEDTTKTTSPSGAKIPSLSEVEPSKDIAAGLGAIVNEDKALEIGGEPTEDEPWSADPTPGGNETPNETPNETKPSPKSNAGLVVALVIVGVVLAGAAVVFVLYKRGIIKIKGKENAGKGGKSTTSTAGSKAKATKSKTATADSKAGATKPKTNATKSKSGTTKPKNK